MRTSIQFRLRDSLLAGVAALLAMTAHAQQMNYQGRLTDVSRSPLPNGQHVLTFNLYTAATNGTRTWGPFITDGGTGDGRAAKADVVNGRFNVILGPNDTSARSLVSAFGSGTPYLEIQVSLNPPILPRQQILSAPKAMHALVANTVTNGAIGTAQLADGSVTEAKLGNLGNLFPWSTAADGASIYRNAGNVGIGTQAPEVKLDVRGGGNLLQRNLNGGDGSLIWNYGTGNATHWGNSQAAPIGIRTDWAVAAGFGFYAYSDRRIKKDIKLSETSEDLRAIRQLRVSDYRMVDPAQAGNSWRKGFIAQEVEQVIPGAVTRSTEFVPDIFSLATASEFDPATKTLTVTLSKDHGVKVGDQLRLQTEDRRQDLAVVGTPSGRTFVVEQCDRAAAQVFVYGRQMKDFRTVDYDRVFTTGIGAMQELAQRLEAVEAELAEVKARLAAQQTITVRWEARFEAMEKRLALQPVMNKEDGRKQSAAAAQ